VGRRVTSARDQATDLLLIKAPEKAIRNESIRVKSEVNFDAGRTLA
jgi:hypothetical protein